MTASQFFESWRRKQVGWPCRFDGHKWVKIGEQQSFINPLYLFDVMRCEVCNDKELISPPPPSHPRCRCHINIADFDYSNGAEQEVGSEYYDWESDADL